MQERNILNITPQVPVLGLDYLPTVRGIPYKSDLDFYAKSREDLTLVDAYGNDAVVVGGVWGVFNNKVDAINISIPTTTIENGFMEFDIDIKSWGDYFIISGTSNIINILETSIQVKNNNIYATFVLANTLGIQHIKILWSKSGGALTTRVFRNGVESITGAFVQGDLFFSTYLIGSYGSIYRAMEMNLSNFIINKDGIDIYKYGFNGHTYDSITGLPATNNGVTFSETTEVLQSTLDAITNGYVDKDGFQIINHSLNTSAVTGYTKMHEGGKLHNGISSFIRFPLGGFFDRSNVTIWNATARTDDYDPTDPTLFRNDKLAYNILNAMLNPDYQDRMFESLKSSYSDVDHVKYISLYATKKTGADLTKVLSNINYDL